MHGVLDIRWLMCARGVSQAMARGRGQGLLLATRHHLPRSRRGGRRPCHADARGWRKPQDGVPRRLPAVERRGHRAHSRGPRRKMPEQ